MNIDTCDGNVYIKTPTKESIVKGVAQYLKISPKYVYVTGYFPNYSVSTLKCLVKNIVPGDSEKVLKLRDRIGSEKDIAFMMSYIEGRTVFPDVAFNFFKNVFPKSFYNKNIQKDEFVEWVGRMKDDVSKIISQNKTKSRLMSVPFAFEGSSLTQTFATYVGKIDIGRNIMDLFDSIQCGEICPFVFMKFQGKEYAKVYEKFSIPDEWIEQAERCPADILFIRIEKDVQYREGKSKQSNIYALHSIDGDGNFVFEHESRDKRKPEEHIGHIVQDGRRIKEIIPSRATAYFEIANYEIEKAVVLHVLSTHDLLRNIFVIKESSRSSMNKPVLTFYYSSTGDTREARTRITMENLFDARGVRLNILISRAESYDTAEEIRGLILGLLGICEKEKNAILKIYTDLLFTQDAEKFLGVQKKQKGKVKGNINLLDLKKQRPDMFVTGYAKFCKNKPFLAKYEDVKDLEDGKAIQFPKDSGDYYVCVGEVEKEFVWPGLKINSISNKDKYPFLPCCFTKNQYEQRSSGLNKYLQGKEMKTVEKKGYVLASSKPVTDGREGALAPVLKDFFSEYGGTEFRRFGVPLAPNSFLKCLEKIFSTAIDMRDILSKIRVEICRQECWDMKAADIKRYVLGDNFIQGEKVYRLFEEYFECNIFFIEYSKKYPKGEMPEMPGKRAYIKKQGTFAKTCVLIKREIPNEDFPFQYEYIKGTTGNATFNSLSQLGKKIIEMGDARYAMISMKTKRPYTPQPPVVNQPPSFQHIDNSGKLRGLVFKKGDKMIMVQTPPSYPLNIQEIEMSDIRIKEIGYKDVMEFLKLWPDTKIHGQRIVNNRAITVYLKQGESLFAIPTMGGVPSIQGVKSRIIDDFPIIASTAGEMDVFETDMKFARVLKSVILWAMGCMGRKLSADDFVVRRTVPSDILDWSNPVFKNKKICSPTPDLIPSLVEYGETQFMNNRTGIQEMAKREIVPGFWDSKNDFTSRAATVLFIGFSEIHAWSAFFSDEKVEKILSHEISGDYFVGFDTHIYHIKNVQADKQRATKIAGHFLKYGRIESNIEMISEEFSRVPEFSREDLYTGAAGQGLLKYGGTKFGIILGKI